MDFALGKEVFVIVEYLAESHCLGVENHDSDQPDAGLEKGLHLEVVFELLPGDLHLGPGHFEIGLFKFYKDRCAKDRKNLEYYISPLLE